MGLFFRIGGIRKTLDKLINHYQSNPMLLITQAGQIPVLLMDPVPETYLYQVNSKAIELGYSTALG